MEAEGARSILIDSLDEVAYMLNIRGGDVAYNPVTYAYLAVTAGKATLFIDSGKLPSEVKNYLRSAAVEVRPYEDVEKWIASETGKALMADPAKFSAYHRSLLPSDVKLVERTSPVAMMKCVKNEAEIQGERRAMLKDAVALAEFYRLAEEESEKNGWDEADLADLVGRIRAKQPGYVSESFGAIVGFRENGAIVHYSPKKGTAKKISGSGMMLIDSGGQYTDGTTDITRVLYIGEPSEEEKKAYTAVLKAHIAIERLVFPEGYSGPQLRRRCPQQDVGLRIQLRTRNGTRRGSYDECPRRAYQFRQQGYNIGSGIPQRHGHFRRTGILRHWQIRHPHRELCDGA